MHQVLLVGLLFLTASAFAAELSPAMEREGDFLITDKNGTILSVGHFDLDFTGLYHAYAAGRKFRGKARFSMGRYDAGKVMDVASSVMAYSIGEHQAVLRLRPGIEDTNLDLIFQFDPSVDIMTADVVEGPRTVGSADIRFRKKEPSKHTTATAGAAQ